jgi:hypothetical protein
VRELAAGVEAFVATWVLVALANPATLRQNVRVRWALGVVVWVLAVGGVRADAGVVLREGGAPRPGLCAALRIQLTGVAEVRCEAEPAQAALSERIAATSAELRAQDARLGVLLERDPDPALVRMYIVAAHGDQAVIAIERIEDRAEPDVDRSLALKVSDAYEAIAIVRTAVPERAPPVAAALQPAQAPAASRRWDPLLEVGGGLHLERDQLRGLANILLGVGVGRGALRFELGAGARLDSESEATSALRSVHMGERGGLLGLRVLWRSSRFEIGGVLEGVFSRISASAVAAERTQHEHFFSPVLGVGADLRLRLFGTAYLRLAPTLEVMHEEQLAIYGSTLLTTGPLRAALPLSLLVYLPR